MKLVNYLSFRLSAIIIIILLIWSGVYFYHQMTEIYKDLDDGLLSLKQEFIAKADKSPLFVRDMQKHEPLNIIIEEIPFSEAKDLKDEYITTKIFFPTEDENEEVRMLKTAIYDKFSDKHFILKIFTSNVEAEDLVKNILYLLIILWIILGLTLFFASKLIINKANKPFYELLNKLKSFNLNDTEMISFPETKIYEYAELNKSVESLLNENIRAFNEQKNFIENASHELQTPIAIVANKIELLMNSDLSEQQLEEANSAIRILNRMKRLNSNLLLLSKIKNRQFPKAEMVVIGSILTEVLTELEDIIEYKNIVVITIKTGDPTIKMNKDLAYIMIMNLLKNAVNHNIAGGLINIHLSENKIIISNTGKQGEYKHNPFERYKSSMNDSTGLGLSIVKSITDIYNINIEYSYYNNQHTMFLKFPKIDG